MDAVRHNGGHPVVGRSPRVAAWSVLVGLCGAHAWSLWTFSLGNGYREGWSATSVLIPAALVIGVTRSLDTPQGPNIHDQELDRIIGVVATGWAVLLLLVEHTAADPSPRVRLDLLAIACTVTAVLAMTRGTRWLWHMRATPLLLVLLWAVPGLRAVITRAIEFVVRRGLGEEPGRALVEFVSAHALLGLLGGLCVALGTRVDWRWRASAVLLGIAVGVLASAATVFRWPSVVAGRVAEEISLFSTGIVAISVVLVAVIPWHRVPLRTVAAERVKRILRGAGSWRLRRGGRSTAEVEGGDRGIPFLAPESE